MKSAISPAVMFHQRTQLVLLGCGVAFFVLFFLALYSFMDFIPPPSPLLDGPALIAKYREHIVRLRVGIMVGIIGAGMLIPWAGLVAMQIARMEQGRRFPLLAVTSLAGGTANAVFFMLPFVLWAGAFYRIDNAPQVVLVINDMAWLEFVMLIPPFCVQTLCLGFAVLSQVEGEPVFPRWYGYLSIWATLLVVPGLVGILFYSGPFAWNGLIAFWLPVAAFSVYLTLTYVLFYKAIMSHGRGVAA